MRFWPARFYMLLLTGILLCVFATVCGIAIVAAHADSSELVLGGITYHNMQYGDVSERYSNKISHDGRLILTPTLGYGKTQDLPDTEYTSETVFLAANSVGGPSPGGLVQWGLRSHNLQAGLALGAYAQDDTEFRKRGIAPFTCVEVGSVGLVPLGGIALNYQVELAKRFFLKINNIFSPVITNHSLSIGKSF